MLAVIYRNPRLRGAGTFPLAGPPLVVRQLQWLRSCGFERVALEVGPGEEGESVRRVVATHRLLAHNVVFVRSAEPLAPSVVGALAGLGSGRILALGESVIGSADLGAFYRQSSPFQGVQVGRLAPPRLEDKPRFAEVRLLSAPGASVETVRLEGWGVSLETRFAAHQLACAALLGKLPSLGQGRPPALLIHAAELSPGVWVARGGRIHGSAQVRPPVLVGADARVCEGARIGPGAFIGDRAIIEPGAVVEHALVAQETRVGEGLRVRRACATPEGLTSLEGEEAVTPLEDPLLLSRRRALFSWLRRSP